MICVGLHNEALYYGQQQNILFMESTENWGCLFSKPQSVVATVE